MEILQRIWNNLKIKYYWFIRGIFITIKWFPIIWNDRQWDNVFFYKILKKKLILIEEAFRSSKACSVNSKREADNIKKCIYILDRLIENNYIDNVYKFHNKKWGTPEFNCEEIPDMKGYFKLNITHLNVTTSKEKKQEIKEHKNLMMHENYLIKQDLEYLFDTIKKYVQNWWD